MGTYHSYYMGAMFAHNNIHRLTVGFDKNGFEHLKRMIRVYCLHVLINHSAPLAVSGYLSVEQYDLL
jgi:hypothetical protein